MGLLSALSSATSGLKTINKQLETVASNIANADTEGYTVKTTTTSSTYNADGSVSGVTTTGTQRSIDLTALSQYWTELSSTNYASAIDEYVSQLDEMFGGVDEDSSIDALFSSFTEALQALETSPDDSTAQLEVLYDAESLANSLNDATETVQGLRQNAEDSLESSVDDLNSILEQIEALDQEIQEISQTGEEPSGLLDARDSLIGDLSELVEIDVEYGDNNSVRITTSKGLALYDQEASTFTFEGNSNVTASTTSDNLGSICLVTSSGAEVDVSDSFNTGTIGALFELRDDTLVEAQNQLDELAVGLAEAFNSYTVEGTEATSGTQEGFDLDLSELESGNEISLTYVDNTTGETNTVTFVRVDDSSSLPLDDDSQIGIDFSSGSMSDVVSQIQSALGTNFTVSSGSADQITILDDGTTTNNVDITSLEASVTATGLQDVAEALSLFVDEAGDSQTAYTGSVDGTDQSTGFAGRISVNSDLWNDSSLLVQYSADATSADQTRPSAMYEAVTETEYDFVTYDGAEAESMTVEDMLDSIISYQAKQASSASTLLEGQEIVLSNIEARLTESAEVDTDEELAKLVELETAYAANARVMTAVQEMLDALLSV